MDPMTLQALHTRLGVLEEDARKEKSLCMQLQQQLDIECDECGKDGSCINALEDSLRDVMSLIERKKILIPFTLISEITF